MAMETQAEQDFMASLLAGLDQGVFDDLPSSPAVPSQPRKTVKASSSMPPKATKEVAGNPTKPFWETFDTVPTGHGAVKRPRTPPASNRPAAAGAPLSVKSTNAKAGRKAASEAGKQVTPSKPRAPKFVRIELDEEKENAPATPALFSAARKGKGKAKQEPDDFDALMDGMDWDDFAPSPVAVRSAAKAKAKAKPVVEHQPRSQQYTRCTVVSVSDEGYDQASRSSQVLLSVTIAGSSPATKHNVLVRDDWLHVPIMKDDIVHLVGVFDSSSSPAMVIDRKANFLIMHPDLLLSPTKIADSSSCSRKAFLQTLLRTIEKPSEAVLLGNVLHEVMQRCMVSLQWDDDFIENALQEVVRELLPSLWAGGFTPEKVGSQVRERSARFGEFFELYFGQQVKSGAYLTDPRSMDASRATIAVTQATETEEDIWAPRWGMKGKIDASMNVRVRSNDVKAMLTNGAREEEGKRPFEIKTGKPNVGTEHRAQTMLYTLLLGDRYDEDVQAGLLYYTQSNQLIQVPAARNELRGLLIARNQLAGYLHRRMKRPEWKGKTGEGKVEEPEEEEVEQDIEEIPVPIDNPRSCGYCFVNDACMLYRKAIDRDQPDEDDEKLSALFEEKVGLLSDRHSDFFRTWEKLVTLEERELVRFKNEIWTMSAAERAAVGRCLADMVVEERIEGDGHQKGWRDHKVTYRIRSRVQPLFSQPSQGRVGTLIGLTELNVGDPVVVSLEEPATLAIARGFIIEVAIDSVVLGLDHTLPEGAEDDAVFRVDKDELAAGLGRIRDNLVQLFVGKRADEQRRRLVVDLEAPHFGPRCDVSEVAPSHLNDNQREAIEHVLSASDYALLLGMPGTGKTTTIAEIVLALVRAGKSVLLTSYTHSAVDTILLKLVDSGADILRVGNREKVMKSLHHLTMDPRNPPQSLKELDRIYRTPQVVGATCLSINDPIFLQRKFDYCIVDEASQVTLPTCLGPLRFAETFVLVGDDNQLPPLVRNRDALSKGPGLDGLDVSLFRRLAQAHPASVVNLTLQYRMNKEIMLLANKLVYNAQLKAGSLEVANQSMKLPELQQAMALHTDCGCAKGRCWLAQAIDPTRKVVFLDTDQLSAQEHKAAGLIDNKMEALMVAELVEALRDAGASMEDVGVISFYRHQIRLLSRLLSPFPAVEVLTADRSQGRDKECIIISLTRSNLEGDVGDLLRDWRRVNVAITRAKSKLVIIGSRSTVRSVEILEKMLAVVDEERWGIQVPKEAAHLARKVT